MKTNTIFVSVQMLDPGHKSHAPSLPHTRASLLPEPSNCTVTPYDERLYGFINMAIDVRHTHDDFVRASFQHLSYCSRGRNAWQKMIN